MAAVEAESSTVCLVEVHDDRNGVGEELIFDAMLCWTSRKLPQVVVKKYRFPETYFVKVVMGVVRHPELYVSPVHVVVAADR